LRQGIALENLGRYEELIDSFDKAVQIKPDDHKALQSAFPNNPIAFKEASELS